MNGTTTPDTTAYLLLALVVFFGILALFIASMVVRYRNVQKELQFVEKSKDS